MLHILSLVRNQSQKSLQCYLIKALSLLDGSPRITREGSDVCMYVNQVSMRYVDRVQSYYEIDKRSRSFVFAKRQGLDHLLSKYFAVLVLAFQADRQVGNNNLVFSGLSMR
jgi:hypothetical protein